MAQLTSVEIFSKNCHQADERIPVSGEWTIEKLKLEIRSRLKKENFSIYFHNGVEIEFDNETLLGQLFGPEIINEQGVAQVDVFLPSAALVTIKSESNFEILEASGEILSLEAGPENSKTVDLKRIGYLKEFPAKLRVLISKPRANTVLVRHYEIKQECGMVEIKANGDIWCDEQPRLAANEGTVMQFNCKSYNQKYWKKAKNSHYLPETVHISPTAATKFWAKEKSVVQNVLLCCQAAYHESPESFMASIENRFPAGSYECIYLENIPQKCVLAFCNETSTLYIAFRGSKALDDWLVNLDVETCNFPDQYISDLGPLSKVHSGFFKRAESWINVIMDKIEELEWEPERMITTGHSLGAATSSIVHILLVLNSQSEEMRSLEYHNIAFATPLFGNLDLKKAILSYSDPRLKNMYHFVNCDDIVPAVAIIEDVYANLTTGVSIWANRAKSLISIFYSLGFIDMTEDQEEQFVAKVENLITEVNKRKVLRDPVLQNRGADTYMPIGNFIFMKKKDSGKSDLHVFEFENSDHQWIGQILVKSLEILGDLKVRKFKNAELAHKIQSDHGLQNYFAQVTDCLTSGVHDNLMQWKLATDLKKMLEKINGPPQQNGDS